MPVRKFEVSLTSGLVTSLVVVVFCTTVAFIKGGVISSVVAFLFTSIYSLWNLHTIGNEFMFYNSHLIVRNKILSNEINIPYKEIKRIILRTTKRIAVMEIYFGSGKMEKWGIRNLFKNTLEIEEVLKSNNIDLEIKR